MTIVIAGGSGFIGTHLAKTFLALGHTVIVIDVKSPSFTDKQLFYIQCNVATQPLPYNVLERSDAVINLVGAPINLKWTPAYKKEIKESRVESTKTIVAAIAAAQNRPSVFINASAIGYYGDTQTHSVDERGIQGNDFLAEVVSAWEEEALKAMDFGVRTVLIRTAPVLGNGGMLRTLLQTAKFGFLLRLSKKNFWMSWIHEDDLVAVYLFALETITLQGVVNAVAPHPIKSHEFMNLLAKRIHRKIIGAVPHWLGKNRFGELYDALIIDQQVVPQRLIDKGFTFLYPTAKEAFEALYPSKHKKEQSHETSR